MVGGASAGLEVSFACSNPLGCNDVSGGESREMTMAIKELAAGDNNFSVEAPGVSGAIERDRIRVGEDVPGRLPLLGASAALGWRCLLSQRIQPPATPAYSTAESPGNRQLTPEQSQQKAANEQPIGWPARSP